MRTWKRFSFISFLLALLITGAGYIAWKFYPAKFKAQARLYVLAQQPRILFQTVETQESGLDAYKRYQSTQVALVKSQLVLNSALRDSRVSQYSTIQEQVDPVAWLEENLNVEFVAGSEVMEISLSGDKPEEVAGIVNATAKAYMDEVVNKDAKLRSDRYDRLRKIKEDYAVNLKERRDKLRKLAEQAGLDDRDTLALQQQYRLEHLAYLEKDVLSQRLKLRIERAEAETLLARRKGAPGAATDPVRKEIAQIEDRLAVLSAGQKVLDEELEGLKGVELGIHGATVQVLDLTSLTSLKDDIAQMEESARKVGAELEALTVELQAPRRIRMIDEAEVPHRP